MRNRKLRKLFSVFMVIFLMTTSLHLGANRAFADEGEVLETSYQEEGPTDLLESDLEEVPPEEPPVEEPPVEQPSAEEPPVEEKSAELGMMLVALQEEPPEEGPPVEEPPVEEPPVEELPVEELPIVKQTLPTALSSDKEQPSSIEEELIPEEVFFTVTYDSQGGTAFDPVQVKKGDPIGQLPVPVKDGFGFDGWSLAIEGKLIDSSFIVNEDITLFAVWDWILVPNNPDGLSGPESVSAFINYSIYPATSFGTANLKRSSVSIMSLEPGDVVLNKTATPVEDMVNTWDVLLEIEAKDTVTTSDIVLVIDRSGSMRGSKLTNAKNAALKFVDVLLPSTSTRIAVVSFAGEVTTNQALTNNITNLNSAINGLYANGGTFTQAAMRQAAAILDNSEADYKNIVLLSDGEPTYSYGINNPYKMNTANLEPYSITYFDTAWQTTINTPQAQFNTTRVGSGSSMWQRYDNPSGTSNDKYYNSGHAAVAEAGFYKNEASLKFLYTIALDAGTNGTPILEQMASPGKSYTATESELEAIFAAIAGEINAAVKNASIDDPMGMGFEVIGDVTDVETNSGTVNLTGTGIDWQAGTPPLKAGSTDERYAYLSYRIEINDDILDVPVPADGLYETNGPTVVTYTNSAGSTISENFPIPTVDPILLIVEKVLKNDKGEIITDDDRIFDIHVTSDDGYDQTYSLKAGEKKVMTNLRLEDDYTVSETGVSGTPASALADYDTTVNVYGIDQTTFQINQGSPDSPVLVTNQEQSLGKLTVKKVFNNMPAAGAPTSRMMSLAAEPLVFSFTVTGPEGFEDTFDLGSGGERTFEGLKYGTYTVVETTTGYDTTYDPAGGEVTLSIGQKEGTVTVTNRVQSGIDIAATKIWDGGPLPYPEVWFRLFRTVDGETFESAGVEDKKIPIESPFTVTWQNLPQYSPEGISYVYSVQESVLGGTNFVPGTPAGYYKTEDGLTVTNKWVTGSFTPAVTKALSGRDLAAEEFEFVLKEGETVLQTVKNRADGTIPFDRIDYTLADVGEHTYTITEKVSGLGGVTDDNLTVTYVVTVSDNGDGTLSVTYETPDDTTFNNTYAATGSFTPSVTKALTGRTLAAGEFTFELKEGATVLQTKSNAADGTIPFTAINYTLADVGEHTYTITEKVSGLGGVTDDTLTVTYVVTVSDNGDGTLSVTYETPDDTTFNNTYAATGSFTPSVTKALTGRTLAAGEFTFELKEGTTVLQTKSNAADGTIPFTAINYTLADVGEHIYTITEKVSGLGGVTDDTLEVTYVVTVTDNGDGTLKVEYDTPTDTIFNNTYTPNPIGVELEGHKELEGRPLLADEFEFELYASNNEFELLGDSLEDVTNMADGSVSFSEIEFNEVGTYYFVIIEKVGGLAGIDYDETMIFVTIHVTDNLEGFLLAEVLYEDENNTFVNKYFPAPVRVILEGEKELIGRLLIDDLFEFELVNDKGTVIQKVANAGKKFSFELIFEEVGEFTFKIREVNGGLAHTTYDTQEFEVVITISDNLLGQLVAEIESEELVFTNTYKTNPSLSVEKSARLLNGSTHFTKVGDLIEFTVIATNTGDVELLNVEIVDDKEGLYDLQFHIEHIDKSTTDNVKNKEVTLLPGEKLVMVALYRVTQADLDELLVVNQATVKGYEPDPNDPEKPLDPDHPTTPEEPVEVEVPGRKLLPDTGSKRTINPIFSLFFVSAGAYLILKKREEE